MNKHRNTHGELIQLLEMVDDEMEIQANTWIMLLSESIKCLTAKNDPALTKVANELKRLDEYIEEKISHWQSKLYEVRKGLSTP